MKTFDEIISSMLELVDDNLDKREGSIIYTALAPCAAALAQMYSDILIDRGLSFASTSSGKYLDMIAEAAGIIRLPAVKAQRRGIFKNASNEPFNVYIGDRFGISSYVFKAVEKIQNGEFILECETAGEVGNVQGGNLLPIDNISGLASAVMTDIILYGSESESDAALYARYKLKVQKPITSGNANHYMQWAKEVAGVGDAKVVPLWNGAGTVLVVVIDADKLPVTPAVVNAVQEYIDSVRPIGALVTVTTATPRNINVSASLSLKSGYSQETVALEISQRISDFFGELVFNADYVSRAKVGAVILSTEGVLDYSELLLDFAEQNITLANDEIPVLAEFEVI